VQVGARENDVLLSAALFAALAFAAWGLTKVFSGRGRSSTTARSSA